MKKDIFINIHQLSTGFIEVPNQVSLNIYVQGCKKRCPSCQNPELQSFSGGHKLFLSDIKEVLESYPLSKWVCWLGGDAIYQPDAFREFAKEFKKNGLHNCLYTGVKLEEIDWTILQHLDVIIDGEWNGKPVQDPDTNQKVWILAPGIEWYDVSWKDLKDIVK